MTQPEFVELMRQARSIGGDYALGYERGLRRLYHGESFGTEAEHEQWLRLGTGDDLRLDRGRGYRDGFKGIPPAPTESTTRARRARARRAP